MVVIVEDADPAKRLRKKQGDQLRLIRTKLRGLTIREVAERMNELPGIQITEQAIGMWERGDTSPRPHFRIAICKVLDTHPSAIWNLDVEVA